MSDEAPMDPAAIAAMVTAVNRILEATRDLHAALGRAPTAEEIAARVAMPVDEVRKIIGPAPPPIVIEPLPDPEPGSTGPLPDAATLARKLGVAVPELTPEEERLLRERFGLDR
jgi:RNA polymerase primary sigma factor